MLYGRSTNCVSIGVLYFLSKKNTDKSHVIKEVADDFIIA